MNRSTVISRSDRASYRVKVFAIALTVLSLALAFNTSAQSVDSAPGTSTYVSPLKWLDSADVDAMFKADIKAGVRKFYVYCAYSCNVLGIEYQNALVCYPTALYRAISGGSDAIVGGEEDRLQGELAAFTRSYNTKLAEYLTLQGFSKCRPGENWKGIVGKIDDLLGGWDEHGEFKEWADPSYDKNAHRFRYATYLLPIHRNNDFYKKVCGIASAAKLSGKVIFEIYDAPTKAALSSISCKDGVESPSDWKPKPGDDPVMPGFDDKQEVSNSSG